MIENSLEYLYANAQVMQIMDSLKGNPILNDLEPIVPSDIVNLSLDLLRIFIQIHDESSEDVNDKMRLLQDISESAKAFLDFSEDEIDFSRHKNNQLCDVLLAIETIDDKDLLIKKILSREILK